MLAGTRDSTEPECALLQSRPLDQQEDDIVSFLRTLTDGYVSRGP